MSIRKICPTSVSGAWSAASWTQPVPSIEEWVVGSASAANTLAAGTATVRVALTYSWSTVVMDIVASGEWRPARCRSLTLTTNGLGAIRHPPRKKPEEGQVGGFLSCGVIRGLLTSRDDGAVGYLL